MSNHQTYNQRRESYLFSPSEGAVVLQRISTAAVREPGDDADVVAGRADALGQPQKS